MFGQIVKLFLVLYVCMYDIMYVCMYVCVSVFVGYEEIVWYYAKILSN